VFAAGTCRETPFAKLAAAAAFHRKPQRFAALNVRIRMLVEAKKVSMSQKTELRTAFSSAARGAKH